MVNENLMVEIKAAHDAREQAEQRAERMREHIQNFTDLWDLILTDAAKAYELHEWDICDYYDWEGYVTGEFFYAYTNESPRLKLLTETRLLAFIALHVYGLSERTMAALTLPQIAGYEEMAAVTRRFLDRLTNPLRYAPSLDPAIAGLRRFKAIFEQQAP